MLATAIAGQLGGSVAAIENLLITDTWSEILRIHHLLVKHGVIEKVIHLEPVQVQLSGESNVPSNA